MTRPTGAAIAHPIQPLVMTDSGVIRFKANAIVRYLLDNGGISMNDLAVEDFTSEDREQFAQLIGYSHSGSGDLSYMSDAVWYAAQDEYEERTEKLTTSPERVQIPAESEHVVLVEKVACPIPTCRAELLPGQTCGGKNCGLRRTES